MFTRLSRFRYPAAALLALVVLTILGMYGWLFADLPASDALVTRASVGTTKIYDRHGRLLYEILDPRTGARTRVPLSNIPRYLQQATIATEDATFYTNPGVSPWAILRALYLNTAEGEVVSGGSTITQQLARLVLMTPQERTQRTLDRKLREAIMAVRLSQTYDKDTLLEMYLNEVYYGGLAYGVEAAAQTYFGVHARDLDLAQCALLAGLPQAPARYNPLVYYDAAKARQKVVLDLMVEQGFITRQQADQAYAEPLHFTGPTDALPAPHFVVYVSGQLEGRLGREALFAGGWQVVTTLDLDLQQHAEAIARRHLVQIGEYGATSAALVAIDPATGEVLAMVGSADYTDVEIDGAVNGATALRQPGSAMKPFLYAAAFESGEWTPASVVYDVRTAFITSEGETYVPANHNGVYHGPVTLREALANSYNLPAVILQDRVGTDRLLDAAHAFGLTTLRDARRYDLALTLGGGEVTLLDMTAAYAVFPNGGIYRPPVVILSIAPAGGGTATGGFAGGEIAEAELPAADSRAISPQAAYLVTHILSDNDARAPGFGVDSALRLSRPAAAKTGTTTNWRDNWTLGYTPDLVVGVWVGNAGGAPMRHLSGAGGAGPIWHTFMEVAHRGLPVRDFDVPGDLVWREICPISGHLASPHCPYAQRELFISGTEPQETCDQHVVVPTDRRTGRPATVETPAVDVVEKVHWVAPPELRAWADARGIPYLEPDQVGESANRQIGESTDSPAYELVLTSPDPNATFALAPYLPPEQQRIAVQAEAYTDARPVRVILYVDGRILAVLSEPPYRALWALEPGRHTFHAVAEMPGGTRLRSETVVVFVEE